MIKTKLLIGLSLILSLSAQSQEKRVMYFNPYSTTTLDGKFVLVSVKEKVVGADGVEKDDYFFRFARVKKQSNAERVNTNAEVLRLVSSRVFGSFEGIPDPREYGPTLTQTSWRHQPGSGKLAIGELLAVRYQARKWSDVVVLKYDANNGTYKRSQEIQDFLTSVQKEAESKLENGIKEQLGERYTDQYRAYNYSYGSDLLEKNWGDDSQEKPWLRASRLRAEIGDDDIASPKSGILIEVSRETELTNKTNENEAYMASYSYVLRINLKSNGKLEKSVLSQSIKLPKNREKAPELKALSQEETQLNQAELKKLNDEASHIVKAKKVSIEQEGSIESVPDQDR